eukprot:509442-Prymnesium_polylepis.2
MCVCVGHVRCRCGELRIYGGARWGTVSYVERAVRSGACVSDRTAVSKRSRPRDFPSVFHNKLDGHCPFTCQRRVARELGTKEQHSRQTAP